MGKRKGKAARKRSHGLLHAEIRARGSVREHEQSFCADVKSWADALFQSRPDLPFSEAKVEQYGPGSHKRQDLRIYDEKGRIALTGEVRLPGTPEGKSAFAESLVADCWDSLSPDEKKPLAE